MSHNVASILCVLSVICFPGAINNIAGFDWRLFGGFFAFQFVYVLYLLEARLVTIDGKAELLHIFQIVQVGIKSGPEARRLVIVESSSRTSTKVAALRGLLAQRIDHKVHRGR